MNSAVVRLQRRLLCEGPMIDFGALVSMLSCTVADVYAAEPEWLTKIRGDLRPKMRVENGIARIPVEGTLAYKPDVTEMMYFGIEDSTSILGMLNEAERSSEVRGLLLDINSPGGMLMGGIEVADAIAASHKPVVAHIGGYGASLAYLLASQADEIVASRGAMVGSIGTIITFADVSRLYDRMGIKIEVITNKEATLKGAGVMGTALTEEQRSYLEERCQKAFADFKDAVVKARGDIKQSAMKGQIFDAREAKELGLVDRVGDLDFAAAVLSRKI